MYKNHITTAMTLLASAMALSTQQSHAAVPTYNLVWLGQGNNLTANGSYAEDINNNNQVVGYTYDTTTTPTGPGSATLFYNWRHSAVWTPPASVVLPWNLDEINNAAFQPCTFGVLPATSICPDITSASAINDSGLVVGMANVPAPTTYFLPSGSGWDHSYYFDFTNNGPVLPVPTTYGVNYGHYDYTVDVNSSGALLGFMDGSFNPTVPTTVGYVYTPGNTQVTTLPQPVLSNGQTSDIAYTAGISDPDSTGAVTVVGYGSSKTPNAYGGYDFSYSPVIWQGNTAGKEIPGFALYASTPITNSFAQGVNNFGQIVGQAANASGQLFARLYNANTQQTVSLLLSPSGLGGNAAGATHINNRGSVTVTDYLIYPYGGAYVFYPDTANAQTGQTCKLDANTVPALTTAPNDHIDTAKSINDNGYIVGGGTHNGLPEAYVLIPTTTTAATPLCTQPTALQPTTTPPPIAAISFAPTLPIATQGLSYSAALSASGGVAPFTYTATGLPSGLSINNSNILGTPTVSGLFQVTITAIDSTGNSVNATIPLSVAAPAIIFAPTLPSATQGKAYSATLTASGGVAPFTYSAAGLPAGLSLSGSAITGTPTVSGLYQVSLTATDSKGGSVSSTTSLSVAAPAIIFTPTLPSATQGTAYSATLTASGGVAPFTYTATGLPSGLSLSSGVVAGTPTVTGQFPVTLTATDIKGNAVSATVTLSVAAAPAPTPAPAPSCTAPTGSKAYGGIQANATAVNGASVTIGTTVVTVPACATIKWQGNWSGLAKAIRVGYNVQVSKGYTLNGTITATSLIVDNGL